MRFTNPTPVALSPGATPGAAIATLQGLSSTTTKKSTGALPISGYQSLAIVVSWTFTAVGIVTVRQYLDNSAGTADVVAVDQFYVGIDTGVIQTYNVGIRVPVVGASAVVTYEFTSANPAPSSSLDVYGTQAPCRRSSMKQTFAGTLSSPVALIQGGLWTRGLYTGSALATPAAFATVASLPEFSGLFTFNYRCAPQVTTLVRIQGDQTGNIVFAQAAIPANTPISVVDLIAPNERLNVGVATAAASTCYIAVQYLDP